MYGYVCDCSTFAGELISLLNALKKCSMVKYLPDMI